MPAISVSLRVVGIQYQTTVTIDKDSPKIIDVLEAARQNGSGFNYVTAPDGTLHQASALNPARASVSSGRHYPAGLYILSDGTADADSVTTWQWYLIRNGIQVNQPNGKTEPFSKENLTLLNGDSLIWRLVVVATRPVIAGDASSYETKKRKLS